MEIKEKYVRKYWYKMVEDQVYDDYKEKEYDVERQHVFAEHRVEADLYATRGDEKIIIEIVSREKEKSQVMRLYKLAHEIGAELKIIYANFVPIASKNGFEGFENEFEEYLNDICLGDFDQFGTHHRVEEIVDTVFSGIYVNGGEAELIGSCTVELAVCMEKDDPEYTYHVPCEFKVEMKLNNKGWYVKEHKQLDIDSSQLDR